ncbi:MAG: thioredoxin [Bacteroidota bacterium]
MMWITITIIATLVILFGLLIFNARQKMNSLKDVKESEKIKVFTDQNFQNKIKNGMVLVDFWASWCMPCKMMVPVLSEVAEEVNGKVTIAKVNVDEQKATAAKFGIRSIPTMILFQNGREVKRIVGVKTKDYLLKEFDRRISL